MKALPEKTNRLAQNSGQSTIEGLIGLGVIIVPTLIGIGYALKKDWEISKCAHLAYRSARSKLIRDQTRSRVEIQCGATFEKVQLASLEDLDQDKGAFDLGDLGQVALDYWELFLSSRSSRSPSP